MEQQVSEAMRQRNRLVWLGYQVTRASAWPGRVFGWLNLVIVVAVLGSVVGSLLRVNEMVSWGFHLPVFGSHLTLTGVAELQWHLFGLMVMLGAAYAVLTDRHIRVDFIYSRLSHRWQLVVDLVGDLLFLIPFCVLMIWVSQNFIRIAFISGEKSDYGGLVDRYVIKTIIPIGFFLLGMSGVGRVLSNLGLLWESRSQPSRGEDA